MMLLKTRLANVLDLVLENRANTIPIAHQENIVVALMEHVL